MTVTSIARLSIDQLGGPRSILVRQRREHARLDQLLARVRDTTGTEQDEALEQTARLVFPHAFAEEAVLWPLARRVLPRDSHLTLVVEREHQQINELWTTLEQLDHDDPERPVVIRQLITLLQQDVRDEEDELLPRLQHVLGPAELRRAGTMWGLVRRVAPTRPHPTVARRPPGNVLSALPLSALDRARDRVDRVARRGPGRAAAAATAASRRLASAAGAVERLRPMRRGEHPSTAVPEPVRAPAGLDG